MESFILEDDLFSSEESNNLPTDWSFILNAPLQTNLEEGNENNEESLFNETQELNELDEITRYLDLKIKINKRYLNIKVEPSSATDKYSLNQISEMIRSEFVDLKNVDFKFYFEGSRISNEQKLNQIASIYQHSKVNICAVPFTKQTPCFMCLSTECKHLRKSKPKNERKRKISSEQENEMNFVFSSSFSSSFVEETEKSRTKKRKTVKAKRSFNSASIDLIEETSSEDSIFGNLLTLNPNVIINNKENKINSNKSNGPSKFSIIDPLGIYQI